MKDKIFILGKIVGLLIFILAFSMMGIASGKPIMILGYAGFFVVVMFLIFLFVRKNQRHFEIMGGGNKTIRKIIGIVMILVAVALPVFSVTNMQLFELNVQTTLFMIILIVLAITLALIAAVIFAVFLINRAGSSLIHKIIGYVIVIIASAVPALLVIPHDKTTTGIGSVYYVAMLVAVLCWWGLSLFFNKE